jgi:NADH-quinone oxidoreductase subunit C
MTPAEILSLVQEKFPGAVTESKLEGVLNPYLVVLPDRIAEVGTFLRDNESTRFNVLMCLSGMDYTGGKFGVVYHLDSTALNHKITLKVQVAGDSLHVASVEQVWKTANWHEREAFDMYGIVFDGHPDLRRILLPNDWEGYPLRKDYKVPEYYQGMKVPY